MKNQSYGDADAWFGKEDTPAPQSYIADPAPKLTVAVAAQHRNAKVVVRYRRPDTSWQNLDIRKGHRSKQAQYYTTRFSRSEPGIRVEYEVFVRLPGTDRRSERRVGETCWFEVAAKRSGRSVEAAKLGRNITGIANTDSVGLTKIADSKPTAPAGPEKLTRRRVVTQSLNRTYRAASCPQAQHAR